MGVSVGNKEKKIRTRWHPQYTVAEIMASLCLSAQLYEERTHTDCISIIDQRNV